MRELTGRQRIFVEHYCGDCNYVGTKAYLAAGYASSTGYEHNVIRLLHKDYIKAAIKEFQAKTAEKVDVTVEFVVQTLLSGLALAKSRNNLVAMARFAELLGRYKAMFTDNIATTDVIKQRELDEAKQARVRRIAGIMLKEGKEAG